MNKSISIKEARVKKGISIVELSNALRIDQSIIDLLENELELPDKYKNYASSYKNSIYRYLGYHISSKNHLKDIPNDNTKLFLTIFFLLFTLIILCFLSLNIYLKFNEQISKKIFKKDEIYYDMQKFLSSKNIENIDHKLFLNSLFIVKRSDYSKKFIIVSNTPNPIYFKANNRDKKTIKFGEILFDSLVLDLESDFLIDISNIRYIDKIIYRGVEFKINMKSDFYLKNFEINKMEKLL